MDSRPLDRNGYPIREEAERQPRSPWQNVTASLVTPKVRPDVWGKGYVEETYRG